MPKQAVVILFIIGAFAAPVLQADTCPSAPGIPNFRRVGTIVGSTVQLAWDAPNATPGLQYEVVQRTASDYCAIRMATNDLLITTTSATSFTYTLTAPNVVAGVYVRLASDHCIASTPLNLDSFTTVPARPPAPNVTGGDRQAALSVSYSDPRSIQLQFQRAAVGDFNFQIAAFADVCASDPKTAIDNGAFPNTTAPPQLPSGNYQYRVLVSNAAGFAVSSPAVTTVGTVPMRIVSFTATPSTINQGQPASVATLSWTTEGAASVDIQPFPGHVNASGSITVKPTQTTTYTLTASQGTSNVTATVTVTVLAQPFLNITKFPDPIVQLAGTGGGTTTYGLTNSGGTAAPVTLTQTGDFVSQSPSSFTLEGGATQIITVTGTPQPEGAIKAPVLVSYIANAGGTSTLRFQIPLFSTRAPTAPVTADAQLVRIDVSAPDGTNPTGSATYKNSGTGTLTGVLSSDVAWIVPQAGSVTIPPRQSGTFTFAIDRSQRPDGAAPTGSLAGHLKLTFLNGAGASLTATPLDSASTPSVTIVKVVDTVQPSVTNAIGGVPALGANEVALFVAGVGHTTSSTGSIFVSDVSFLNPQGSKPIDDVKIYYTTRSGTANTARTTNLPSVPGQVSVTVADVVKNIFSGTDEVGTLHVRSRDADKLAVAATILSTNTPAGTFGNAIPVLRSDRSAGPNETLVLTGLRKDGTTHTNLYLQETAGVNATVRTDFYSADGAPVGTRQSDAIEAFKLLQLADVAPANAVMAIITNTATNGKIAGYATAVDETTGDTWALADWSSQLGYATSEVLIIPIAGSVHGANGTLYRSDLAITNRGTSAASGTLTYIARDGARIDRPVTLGAHQTQVTSDVIPSRFGVTGDTTGYLLFTPSAGSFAVTSRSYTGTFSTGVPALAAASAMKAGGIREIGGLADAERSATVASRPGTFRTNFAIMETSGQPVTIRVTFRFTFPAGDKVQGTGGASRDYVLNGNQFMMLNSITGEILGPPRLQYGDLQNVIADFQVVDGNGTVIVFTSSVDNATGDAILRTE